MPVATNSGPSLLLETLKKDHDAASRTNIYEDFSTFPENPDFFFGKKAFTRIDFATPPVAHISPFSLVTPTKNPASPRFQFQPKHIDFAHAFY